MIIVKIILIILLSAICYQDAKDRLVYWFLFPLSGGILGLLHYKAVGATEFIMTIGINMFLVAFILLLLRVYARNLRNFKGLLEVFGLGDVFMLLVLGVSCATVAFLVLLVFGLVFSLVLHLVLEKVTLSRKRTHPHNSVPLAGYLSLFFGVVLLAQWFNVYTPLYVV